MEIKDLKRGDIIVIKNTPNDDFYKLNVISNNIKAELIHIGSTYFNDKIYSYDTFKATTWKYWGRPFSIITFLKELFRK